ncbi:EAL domain-containing protein [Sphingomonas sp.]|uniref:EAL domain-containing protein n=1 Tax=Sphingomonas sp. TaxID=28214 RepID=UPI003CC5F5C3
MTAIDPLIAAAPKRRLSDDLRGAIGAGEIELRYQPQVAMADGRIIGVEALARWQHPTLGELGADRLFAAATRAALLPELSQHIQRKAIGSIPLWPASLQHLTVAINVTASDLASPGFAEDLLRRAPSVGVAPARLTVEVTEHDLIADLSAAAAVLGGLRAAGVKVALDDFGTGYSSLAWLKALPLDYLKIDGALSRDLLGSRHDQVVVRHVIAIGRELGLGVIAEGVETEAHRALLAEAGATHYQGFLCAGPLAAAALAALVEAR